MSTVTKLQSLPVGYDLAIKDIFLSETAIASCLAYSDPRNAVLKLAESTFDAANSGTIAKARKREEHVGTDQKVERGIMRGLGRKRDGIKGLYAETPSRPDKRTRMSWPERLTHWFYVLLRFILLAVTVALIAMYVRSSTYSADLSSSWPMALAFGFPVLLLSYALSCMVEATDDLEAKRRVAKTYTWLGALVLLIWALSSSALFGFDASAAVTGFTVSFDAPPPVVHGDWFSILFPKTLAGKLLLLTHVVGDVLISAACGVWSKLVGLKGRKTVYDERADARAWREQYDLHAGRARGPDTQIEMITGVEADYTARREACTLDAMTRLEAMLMVQLARRTAADVDTLRAYGAAR